MENSLPCMLQPTDQEVQLISGHVCTGGGAGGGSREARPPADGARRGRHRRCDGHALHAPRYLSAVSTYTLHTLPLGGTTYLRLILIYTDHVIFYNANKN